MQVFAEQVAPYLTDGGQAHDRPILGGERLR
jgi:hypothetical protein